MQPNTQVKWTKEKVEDLIDMLKNNQQTDYDLWMKLKNQLSIQTISSVSTSHQQALWELMLQILNSMYFPSTNYKLRRLMITLVGQMFRQSLFPPSITEYDVVQLVLRFMHDENEFAQAECCRVQRFCVDATILQDKEATVVELMQMVCDKFLNYRYREAQVEATRLIATIAGTFPTLICPDTSLSFADRGFIVLCGRIECMDPIVRIEIAFALGQIPVTSDALLSLVLSKAVDLDEEAYVGQTQAAAMTRTPQENILHQLSMITRITCSGVLLNVLQDPVQEVRKACARSLIQLCQNVNRDVLHNVTSFLCDLLADLKGKDDQEHLLQTIASMVQMSRMKHNRPYLFNEGQRSILYEEASSSSAASLLAFYEILAHCRFRQGAVAIKMMKAFCLPPEKLRLYSESIVASAAIFGKTHAEILSIEECSDLIQDQLNQQASLESLQTLVAVLSNVIATRMSTSPIPYNQISRMTNSALEHFHAADPLRYPYTKYSSSNEHTPETIEDKMLRDIEFSKQGLVEIKRAMGFKEENNFAFTTALQMLENLLKLREFCTKNKEDQSDSMEIDDDPAATILSRSFSFNAVTAQVFDCACSLVTRCSGLSTAVRSEIIQYLAVSKIAHEIEKNPIGDIAPLLKSLEELHALLENTMDSVSKIASKVIQSASTSPKALRAQIEDFFSKVVPSSLLSSWRSLETAKGKIDFPVTSSANPIKVFADWDCRIQLSCLVVNVADPLNLYVKVTIPKAADKYYSLTSHDLHLLSLNKWRINKTIRMKAPSAAILTELRLSVCTRFPSIPFLASSAYGDSTVHSEIGVAITPEHSIHLSPTDAKKQTSRGNKRRR